MHTSLLTARLSLAALAGITALAVASVRAIAEPSKVAQGKATNLGVMSVSLKDAVNNLDRVLTSD